MSRLTDLIARTKSRDQTLGEDLEREFKLLSSRRAFGLNFERHQPETVELPGRPIRKGDKVRLLPERGSLKKGDQKLWRVVRVFKSEHNQIAEISSINLDETITKKVSIEDLVVVAEFRDYIYPGLVSTGRVERGEHKPYHSVINGENFHVLEALTFTHRGRIDVIYIDPPYNTGAKDWKYNNNYVESEDIYRHSKWLAFLERRLKIAKELLNPSNSALIITIDEKEYLRLGLLLEQTFPEAKIQMVSTIIKPEGTNRTGEFSRTNEFIYFVMFGEARVQPFSDDMSGRAQQKSEKTIEWRNLRRRENTSIRSARPNQFYAIFVDKQKNSIHSVGDPIPLEFDKSNVDVPKGCYALFPLKPDGTEMLWGVTPESLRNLISLGYARVRNGSKGQNKASIQYLASGTVKAIKEGKVKITGKDHQGAVEGIFAQVEVMPKTTWNKESHNAQTSGTLILSALIPNRRFPFPKSLYAVEDCLRFFIGNKKDAVVLDFFAGSGTTAHAVMRLNKQDGGKRQSISVTNNEVAADEQSSLREKGFRPGDTEWEKWGICDYITKPRIKSAITGKTPEGQKIYGEYKFTDQFALADGFEENAEFFTLTYETPLAVRHNLAFERIAPLLWIRAGAEGEKIEKIPESGWDLVDRYGVLVDLDKTMIFCKELSRNSKAKIAYIFTDDDRRFQAVCRHLPKSLEVVRLYESYLSNFRFSMGR